MRLLALDQASRTSGFAVFEDGKLYDYGTFTFVDDNVGERLFKIRERVAKLIADYDIDFVAFEDIQLQNNTNNVKTFKILAEVFGVIYELVSELKLPHEVVFSGSWKSTCGVKGRTRPEQKKNAQAYVLQQYNIKATQDESDAICLGTHVLLNTQIEKSDYDWSE